MPYRININGMSRTVDVDGDRVSGAELTIEPHKTSGAGYRAEVV
jgi:hypothetical protein